MPDKISLVCVTRREVTLSVLCGLCPGCFTKFFLLLRHMGGVLLYFRFCNTMEKMAAPPSQLFSFVTTTLS